MLCCTDCQDYVGTYSFLGKLGTLNSYDYYEHKYYHKIQTSPPSPQKNIRKLVLSVWLYLSECSQRITCQFGAVLVSHFINLSCAILFLVNVLMQEDRATPQLSHEISRVLCYYSATTCIAVLRSHLLTGNQHLSLLLF